MGALAQDPVLIASAHAESPDVVLASVGSCPDGLDPREARARLERWGPNTIPEGPGRSVMAALVGQFASPLIYVLIFAAALSGWLGEWSDAGFITGVLVLNAAIGAAQEQRAERGARALRTMVNASCDVVRDGEVLEIDAAEVVVGDVVLLTSGGKVPADLRLLESQGLQVDESLLTGESGVVDKDPGSAVDEAAGLGERPTMAFAGTLVGRGRGRGVVIAAGGGTVLGTLAGALQQPSLGEPPLITRMRRFTVAVGLVIGVFAAIVGAVELARGTHWHEVVMVGVALAVSAIPEGLPVALTVALAVAVRRMAQRGVIVRRLVAIESLGSCTVIASDKTGTLTVNELSVTHVAVPGDQPRLVTGTEAGPTGTLEVPSSSDPDLVWAAVERLARAGVLCNEATLAEAEPGWIHRGDAVDVALLVLGRKFGITRPSALDSRPQVAALPYESEQGYAATLHRAGDTSAEIVVKGSVEHVSAMCRTMQTLAGVRAIDVESIAATAESLATGGERLLALATGTIDRPAQDSLHRDQLTGLTFLGLVGMTDPLRADSAAAVAQCQRAGISVVMVTGDHPSTALNIACTLGLAERPDQVVTGAMLRTAGDQDRDALIAGARVFARVEPAQKYDIVASLIRQGHVVAVTGDGANDAPAMHHAHVGIAMGASGTDVARESAELIVTDDRLASIAAGVEEGRIAYANIRKVIQLLVSTGAGELVLVLVALVVGLPLPLLAVQLLWLNLVTNGIQDVALAFEPAEGDEMRRPPRSPGEPIFNRLMIERVLLSAVVIGGVTVTAYQWLLHQGWSTDQARNSVVLLMVLFENVHVLNSRSETRSALTHNPLRNPLLLAGTVVAQLLHVLAMHLPVTQSVLGLQPVSWPHWLTLLGLASTLLVAVELHKALWRRRQPAQHAKASGASFESARAQSPGRTC